MNLWTEKYRPRYLDDIIGQEDIIKKLKSFVTDKSIPNLLFTGEAGIGKTTTALALIREVQKDKMKRDKTYMELNASDDRGIDVVRSVIKNFAKMTPPSGIDYKFIILDESDSMTPSAQQALRRIMEEFADTCRFILICNFSNKIIPPIQSRVSFIRFNRIPKSVVKKRLQYIALKEGVEITPEGIDAIVNVSSGDLRKSINLLQSCASMNEEITDEIVYEVSGFLEPEEIRNIMKTAIEKGFEEAYKMVERFIKERGLSAKNLIRQMDEEVMNLSIDDIKKHKIISALSDAEKNISNGGTEEVQLAAMLVRISRIV